MIQPINGMLLLEQEEKGEKTTASGLVLSATISDLGPKRGKIVAVGSGEMNHFTGGTLSMDNFSVGDIVLFPDHSGIEVEDGDKKYLVIHNKHIIAKVGE